MRGMDCPMRRLVPCSSLLAEYASVFVPRLTGMWALSTMPLCPRTMYLSHGGVTGNGGVIVKSLERKVALGGHAGASTTYADGEASVERAEVAYEKKQVAEKPKVSEEITIEEINIDGMCGVY